jgi:hypothetical protein
LQFYPTEYKFQLSESCPTSSIFATLEKWSSVHEHVPIFGSTTLYRYEIIRKTKVLELFLRDLLNRSSAQRVGVK